MLGIVITQSALVGIAIATIQFATLLYLAALGETIAEKAGVLNLGVEGMMAIGAVTGYIAGAASGSPWVGLLVGGLCGAAVSLIHAFAAVGLGADQVVSGLALTILGLGLADYLGADYTGDARRAWFVAIDVPGLSDIPALGSTVFSASPVSYLAIVLGIATWFVLNRTALGLGIRAAGESASTADVAGHSVARIRVGAIAVGGAMAGMSGAYLTNSVLGTSWNQGVVAGRGWIAVALVIFGAWRPGRVALGSIIFGFTLALQSRMSGFDIDFSPILLSMTPFLMTILVLVVISYRARNQPSPAPAAIGIPYRREER